MTDDQRRAVWAVWGELGADEPAPVKVIAARLGLSAAEVAAVVYPPAIFGEWRDDQEPGA